MAKIVYSKKIYINILYVIYVLNFSVITIFYPDFNLQNIRNILLLVLSLLYLRLATLRLNTLVIIMLLSCILSIVFNDIHPVFNSSLRFAFLVLVMIPLGLIIKPKYSSENLINLKFIYNLNAFIVVASFILFFFGFGSFFQKGNFSGLLSHANTMGPIAGLVFLERFISYFKQKKSTKTVVICAIAFFIVVLTGSRAALFTLLLALCCIGLYIFRLKFILWGSLFIILITAAFFTLKSFNTALIPDTHKDNIYRPRTIFEKGFDNTRLDIWNERLDELIENPLFGSGFSAINTKIIPEESPSYDIETGSIQPGSGYLGVLSMTGLLGFISFMLILIVSLITLYKKRVLFSEANFLLIVSSLTFILLHSIFEGYIFSSGNILFLIFWITIAYIFNKRETKT